MFFGTLRMLCLWCSELEIPRRRFSNKSLSGETGNISRGLAGHGFTKAAMIRWEGAVKPKTRFSLGQGDEIQTFNMRRRGSREFVAGPCLRNFMKQRQLRNEPFAVTGKWEFRITTCSPSLICTIFGGLTIKCHHSIRWMLPPRIETGVSPHLHFLCLTDNAVPIVGTENSLQARTGPSEKFHGAVWEIHNGSCGGTPLHDFSGTQHRVPVWNATKQSVARNFMFRTCALSHLCSLQTLYKAISLHPDPRIKTLSGWVKVTKVTETWECCSFELWMIRGTRPELPSLDAAASPRQGDDGYIVDPPYHISQIPFPRCWRFFRKILAYIQICSNCLCPFTSRSRLFALTTDLPGPADGPLNIVQGNILASWSQNPFRMSEGGESDGNLGVLHIRTLDETRYSSKIAIFWCSCLATSRWWWIHHSSSIHHD